MQNPQGGRPRTKSPFAAAFLSLIFPGLGQLYAGAALRALAFAAPPILLIALGSGLFLRMDRLDLLKVALDPTFISGVFWVNIAVLVYRLIAIVDAYRVAQYMNTQTASGDGRLGPVRLPGSPLALAGLAAVLLVMAGAHVVVARYDLIAQDALTGGCIFLNDQTCDEPSDSPDPSDASVDSAAPSAAPTTAPSPVGSAVPEVSIPPWNGTDRLNILLLGVDTQGGGYRTDTMITVSIDPVTKQVAMFSLPRDSVDVPLPPGPPRSLWGSTYGQKINSLYVNNYRRSDLWPGTDKTRGFNALKATLGYTYGLDIKYFIAVDFKGFRKLVDALGGVTVNVQVPVVDDQFPAGPAKDVRLYIPSGLQHMDGAQALRYARSRETSSDFDRGARQQRILLSLRQQADPAELLPKLPALIDALKSTIKTDIPLDQLPNMFGLATSVDSANIRSYVFSPPLYSTDTCNDPRGCVVLPKFDAIRSVVKNAFKFDPELEAQRQNLAGEAAQVWVLNPTSDTNRGTRLAGYLESQGLEASAPRQRPAGGVPADTQVIVYNGAEPKLPATIAYLEKKFKTKVELKNDPAMRADVVVVIGRDTADLRPPASS